MCANGVEDYKSLKTLFLKGDLKKEWVGVRYGWMELDKWSVRHAQWYHRQAHVAKLENALNVCDGTIHTCFKPEQVDHHRRAHGYHCAMYDAFELFLCVKQGFLENWLYSDMVSELDYCPKRPP